MQDTVQNLPTTSKYPEAVVPLFLKGPKQTQRATKESRVRDCVCNNVIKLCNSVYLIRWNGGSVMCSSKYFVLDFKKSLSRHKFQKDPFSRVIAVIEQLIFKL